jgi:aryl-alcohol dehydrogenase-like predicted oxidoreductase
VAIGLWQVGSTLWGYRDADILRRVREAIAYALEHGPAFFDTAEVYGGGLSERVLGEVVGNDDRAVVVTKAAGFRTTRWSVLRALEASRRRLRRDAIDVALHHWPPPLHARLCSVVRALEDAVDKGLAHYVGVSNYSENLLEKALSCTRRHELVTDQVQYSLAYRVVENGLKQLAEERGLTIMAWSPLAKGALAGKTRADNRARRGDKVFEAASRDERLLETLRRVALGLKVTMAQVAIAWVKAKGAIPVVGVSRKEHAEEARKAARLELSEDAVRELDEASERYVRIWGTRYGAVQSMRLVPSLLQALAIKLMGGI